MTMFGKATFKYLKGLSGFPKTGEEKFTKSSVQDPYFSSKFSRSFRTASIFLFHLRARPISIKVPINVTPSSYHHLSLIKLINIPSDLHSEQITRPFHTCHQSESATQLSSKLIPNVNCERGRDLPLTQQSSQTA